VSGTDVSGGEAVSAPVSAPASGGAVTQLPSEVLQTLPIAQSPSLAQLVLQPLVVHAKSPHATGVVGMHEPAPSQKACGVNEPPAQLAGLQEVVEGGAAQMTETPLQLAPQGPEPPQAGRGARGAPVTVLQVPTLPASLQAWQEDEQRLSQQTPSVQKPDWHSSSDAQVVPFVALAKYFELTPAKLTARLPDAASVFG
jgi:hypothetical protein